MTDNMHEKVSSLVDGELSHDEVDQLIKVLKRDEASQVSWRHYHLISDALKNNLPDKLPEDFVNRVSQALETEPFLSTPPRRPVKHPFFHRPTIGFALAASVAAVTFIGLGWNNWTQVEPGPELVADTSMPAVTPVATVPAISYTKVHGKQWDVDQPAVISKLNNYLLNHDQYSLAGVRSGVLPQVRIVGYERVEGIPQDPAMPGNGR